MILATQLPVAVVAPQAAVLQAASLQTASAQAVQAPAPAPVAVGAYAPSTPGLGGAAAALVLVLALIAGLAWLLKRLPGGGLNQANGLRVVASIPLGSRERAAVVQVGGEQLLVGIGTGGVRTLHVLPEPLPAAGGAGAPGQRQLPDFAGLLARRMGKGS